MAVGARGRYVIKDLIPDMTNFYAQYKTIEPWLQKDGGQRLTPCAPAPMLPTLRLPPSPLPPTPALRYRLHSCYRPPATAYAPSPLSHTNLLPPSPLSPTPPSP
eukprot:1108656-Rhodomonas_salina.1